VTHLAARPLDVPAPPPRPPDRRHVAAVVLLLAVLAGVLLVAFAWPASRSALHDVPLGVAGPAAAADQAERQLAAARPGAFEVHRYADEAAARTAVTEREVYGAVVVGPGGPAVLTASAASPAVAQALTQLGQGLGAAAGAPVRVEDVVPAPADDPRGAGFAAAGLPLVLGGIAAAGLLTVLVAARGWRVAGALAFAVLGGPVMAAILRFWIGALDGSYLVLSGVLALGIAAVSLSLLGLGSLLGRPGLALGAATMIALGNPLSGAASAPEMLPAGWGVLGQLLPPGAGLTLLRSVAFFDGHGGGPALATLTGWVAAGLLLAAAGAYRARRRHPVAG
jgi:hypothetical protein